MSSQPGQGVLALRIRAARREGKGSEGTGDDGDSQWWMKALVGRGRQSDGNRTAAQRQDQSNRAASRVQGKREEPVRRGGCKQSTGNVEVCKNATAVQVAREGFKIRYKLWFVQESCGGKGRRACGDETGKDLVLVVGTRRSVDWMSGLLRLAGATSKQSNVQ
ncbi:predicted protein [Histoplasma capsulatum G186AR]|uniref:Uncharacterized protein n=1 Tax=Ajellomyces capsulatus (strain G186AR / H82 / ATCC MYA-2454 / RMSCC 2432) TaxID=447093 RepID=C0NWJ4_AJECG|nr:uncharacterized protein HCBG_07524 [Histoplasma capsulatum G186AR]EEH04299.1 predicted protein [Histoplasma capsulatum G186AR]